MLKREFIIDSNKDNIGKNVSVKFADNNRYYIFETYLFGQESGKCSQIFE